MWVLNRDVKKEEQFLPRATQLSLTVSYVQAGSREMSPATAGLVIIVTVVKIVIVLVKFHGLEVYSIP